MNRRTLLSRLVGLVGTLPFVGPLVSKAAVADRSMELRHFGRMQFVGGYRQLLYRLPSSGLFVLDIPDGAEIKDIIFSAGESGGVLLFAGQSSIYFQAPPKGQDRWVCDSCGVFVSNGRTSIHASVNPDDKSESLLFVLIKAPIRGFSSFTSRYTNLSKEEATRRLRKALKTKKFCPPLKRDEGKPYGIEYWLA